MRIVLKWLACFLALVVTWWLFPGHVIAAGGIGTLALAALILFLVNLIVKPVMQLVSLPVTLLTAGLFFFVVNAWMVGLTDLLLPSLQMFGFWVKLFCALLVSVANSILVTSRHAKV